MKKATNYIALISAVLGIVLIIVALCNLPQYVDYLPFKDIGAHHEGLPFGCFVGSAFCFFLSVICLAIGGLSDE